jgi:hypothetical protein
VVVLALLALALALLVGMAYGLVELCDDALAVAGR